MVKEQKRELEQEQGPEQEQEQKQEQKQEQGQEQLQPLKQRQEQEQLQAKKMSVVWQCMINFLHFIVQMGAVGFGAWGCKAVFNSTSLQIPDKVLLWGAIGALVIGVICSHAYNHIPGSETNPLRNEASKKQAVWLHANFAWKTISIWMTVTSLYCTGATIYISGSAIKETWAQDRIIIYSILSSVMSMGMYVLRPSNRATSYREAYLVVTKVLINDDGSDQKAIKDAIIKGEEIIAQQDTMAPN